MERLTKYLASGAADYNYPAGCYSGNDCNDRVAKSAYRQTCVERLAAYEETGLTPEAVKAMLPLYDFDPTLRPSDLAELERTQDFLMENGMMQRKVDLKGLVRTNL